MRLRFHRIFAMALLLPLLVLSVTGGGAYLFRCQFTGIASAEHCCPDRAGVGAARAPGDTRARLTPADCCTRETVDFARPPAELRPGVQSGDVVAAPIAIAAAADPVAAPAAPRATLAADPEPGPRTPILLAKRSLLI